MKRLTLFLFLTLFGTQAISSLLEWHAWVSDDDYPPASIDAQYYYNSEWKNYFSSGIPPNWTITPGDGGYYYYVADHHSYFYSIGVPLRVRITPVEGDVYYQGDGFDDPFPSDPEEIPEYDPPGNLRFLYIDPSVVLPDRRDEGPDVFALRPKMTQEMWQSSVLWLTANLPVIDEGETTATWLDASPEKNDAVQTATGRQPDRVKDEAGNWVFRFDGNDDRLALSLPSTNQWTYALLFNWPAEWPTDASGAMFGGGTVQDNHNLGLRGDGGNRIFFRGGGADGFGQANFRANESLRGTTNWLIVRTDGVNNQIKFNTIYNNSVTTPDTPISNNVNVPLLGYTDIGGVVTGYSGLDIHTFIALPTVWTDAQVEAFLGVEYE